MSVLNEIDPHKPIFTMSVAAELAGMHPQTLRKYERAGAVKPARVHNLRLYSQADIELLLRIKELHDKGVNIAGARMVIDLESQLKKGRKTDAG